MLSWKVHRGEKGWTRQEESWLWQSGKEKKHFNTHKWPNTYTSRDRKHGVYWHCLQPLPAASLMCGSAEHVTEGLPSSEEPRLLITRCPRKACMAAWMGSWLQCPLGNSVLCFFINTQSEAPVMQYERERESERLVERGFVVPTHTGTDRRPTPSVTHTLAQMAMDSCCPNPTTHWYTEGDQRDSNSWQRLCQWYVKNGWMAGYPSIHQPAKTGRGQRLDGQSDSRNDGWIDSV